MDYPATLPRPQAGAYTARPGLALSGLPGLAVPRRRFADRAGSTLAVNWTFTAAQMAVFLAWYRTDLSEGQAWFNVSLPGRGGFTTRNARFSDDVLHVLIPGGEYIVAATLELRGRAALLV